MAMRRVPVPQTGAPTELVAEAADAIRAGRIVVLPTETVYGIAALPGDPASSERVLELKERPRELVFTHHLADAEPVGRLAADVAPRVRRLMERYWPGPLTLVLPARDGGTVGVRVPANDFTRAVIRACGDSLFLTSVNRSGDPPAVDGDEVEATFGDRVDVLYDAGRPPLRQASTVVRYRPSDRGEDLGELEFLRVGTLTPDDVLRASSRLILFVCTGNTCRSPMAVALARRAAARRLGTTDERVLAHGFEFASAGVAALRDGPASEGSIRASAELGIDLSDHRATPLSGELLERAERVFCLGPSHLVASHALAPGVDPDRIELLDASGAGIPDPFGGDLEEYRRTRDAIARAVDARIAELVPEPPA